MFDLNLPKLGFGLMRLPEKNNEIDIEELKKMVDSYIEAGFNYFDTAYMYCEGKSENAIKEALVDRYARDSYFIVDKLPIWMTNENKSKEDIFNEQLNKVGVDYFDLYLLHSVDDESIEQYEKEDCFNWIKNKKELGFIHHFGFSYHGSAEMLDKILSNHPEVEIVQIQLNYADWDNPVVQSGKCYEVLRKHNKPILVMEPVKGGLLANLPNDIETIMKEYHPSYSLASWALRFVSSLPNVVTVLSGMSNEEQMKDNIKTYTNFKSLNEEEYQIISKAIDILVNDKKVGCTNCKYCMDNCPMQIRIPDIFKLLNLKRVNSNDWQAQDHYDNLVKNSGKASVCLQCGQCEGVCPQHLPIIKLLEEAKNYFEGEKHD